jgi:hypothetical protein
MALCDVVVGRDDRELLLIEPTSDSRSWSFRLGCRRRRDSADLLRL